MIRRLQRGPASRDELIEAVFLSAGKEVYSEAAGKALTKRFDNDLGRVRNKLGVGVRYVRKLGIYELHETWLPLLDLPNEDLVTIAWLDSEFELDSPQHDEIHDFLGRIRFWLDTSRLAESSCLNLQNPDRGIETFVRVHLGPGPLRLKPQICGGRSAYTQQLS